MAMQTAEHQEVLSAFLTHEDGPVLTGPMNAETRVALEELRAGEGKRFNSVSGLMSDLNDGKDD